jgi:hypothetical protein
MLDLVLYYLVLWLLIHLAIGAGLWCFVWHPKEAEMFEALAAEEPILAVLDVTESIVLWPTRVHFIRSFLEGWGER